MLTVYVSNSNLETGVNQFIFSDLFAEIFYFLEMHVPQFFIPVFLGITEGI
jgi:hypothetical protein